MYIIIDVNAFLMYVHGMYMCISCSIAYIFC